MYDATLLQIDFYNKIHLSTIIIGSNLEDSFALLFFLLQPFLVTFITFICRCVYCTLWGNGGFGGCSHGVGRRLHVEKKNSIYQSFQLVFIKVKTKKNQLKEHKEKTNHSTHQAGNSK